MEIQLDQSSVTLKLTPDEAERLGVALRAGYETASRAEYYIRTASPRQPCARLPTC